MLVHEDVRSQSQGNVHAAERGCATRGHVRADERGRAHQDTATCAVLQWDTHTRVRGLCPSAHEAPSRVAMCTPAHRDPHGVTRGRARCYTGTRVPREGDAFRGADRPACTGAAGRGAAPEGGGFPLAAGAVNGAE